MTEAILDNVADAVRSLGLQGHGLPIRLRRRGAIALGVFMDCGDVAGRIVGEWRLPGVTYRTRYRAPMSVYDRLRADARLLLAIGWAELAIEGRWENLNDLATGRIR